MACKNDKGQWVLIDGNQTCMIFLWYIISNRKATGKMQPTDFIVKTIVTTELIRKIAEKQAVEMRDCYTGFKWIAHEIALSEGKQQYIGGGEESYGFLAEDFVRDKDAVSACSLLAEICAYAKDKGKTLYDILMDIYKEYGFSKEHTINVERPGKAGAEEIQQMMVNFRNNPPKDLGGSKVVLWKDYKTLEARDASGKTTKLAMPQSSNVLQWFCDDDTKVSVRPSGTEPKIKFYIEVKDTLTDASQYEALSKKAMQKMEAIKNAKMAQAKAELVKEDEKFPPIKETIEFGDFEKIDLRVGTVLKAEKHPKADKLLVFQVKIGNEVRQIISGIADYYKPEDTVGKKVTVVANLAPRKLRGLESKGMILFADHVKDGKETLEFVSSDAQDGNQVR